MGEWSTVTYVRSTGLDHVAQAVVALCALEGYVLAPDPPPLSEPRYDAMRYGPGHASPLWAFALVPGAGDWTLVMTAPIELLGGRRPGSARPRLAELAALAGCDAFTFNLYDGTADVLIEANAAGEIACSGVSLDDDWRYHEEPLAEEHAEAGFRLIGVPEPLRRAVKLGAEAIGDLAAGDLAAGDHYAERWWFWYNGVPEELLHHRTVPVPGVRTCFFAAPG